MDKLNIWVSFKITDDMKQRIKKIQEDEHRETMSQTMRALLRIAIELKESDGRQ